MKNGTEGLPLEEDQVLELLRGFFQRWPADPCSMVSVNNRAERLLKEDLPIGLRQGAISHGTVA
jgi:hypothetical protein